jgi:hypothetical protein
MEKAPKAAKLWPATAPRTPLGETGFVLAAVALTMVLTGTLSVVGPVRRALHIDPAHLLREQ